MWYLYIVKCNDGMLYTGITKFREAEFDPENATKGAFEGLQSKRSRYNFPMWYLYILRCSDGMLYTGITKFRETEFDPERSRRRSRGTTKFREAEFDPEHASWRA